MGRDKWELELGGRTFWEHCVARFSRLGAWCAVGRVGSRPPGDLEGGVWLTDMQPDRGPVEGLAVGLAWAQSLSEWAWVSTIDCPVFGAAFVSGLCDVAERFGEDVEVVMPRVEEQSFPLTAIYRTSIAERVRRWVETGGRRAGELSDAFATRWVQEADLRRWDPQLMSLRPLNTPQEWERYRIEWQQGESARGGEREGK